MKLIIAAAVVGPLALGTGLKSVSTATNETAPPCVYITPISSTTPTVNAYSTGNTIDFYVGNYSSLPSTVTVSESHAGNLSNVTFFGGPNPFDLSGYPNTLDVGYSFDAGAAATGGTITVTATAACGSVQEVFQVTIQ